MSNENQNTDSLISSLSEELTEVKVLAHPLQRALPWIVFAVLYVSFAVAVLGVRGDIITKIAEPLFIFEILIVFTMSLAAALCSLWMCVPDMRGQKWIISVPITLFFVFLCHFGLKMVMDNYAMPALHFHNCQREALIFGVIPAIAILYLSIRGNTVQPILLSFMNILAVGGIGYIALRISCASDNIGHLGMHHLLPYIIMGIIITLVGRKLYRW